MQHVWGSPPGKAGAAETGGSGLGRVRVSGGLQSVGSHGRRQARRGEANSAASLKLMPSEPVDPACAREWRQSVAVRMMQRAGVGRQVIK
jgi:hypothetical protein